MQGSFDRFAAGCAVVVGASGLAYAIAFVTILNHATRGAAILSNLLLVVAGLLSTAVFTAVYGRLREIEPGFALWGLIVAVAAAMGSVAHGGYELAKLANTPTTDPGLPNPTDARGLFTFGLSAVALLVVSGLILASARLPRGLGYVGITSALLLFVVYLGRLIVLDPKRPWLLAAAAIVGFVLNPAWYLWMGSTLWRGAPAAQAQPTAAA